MRRRNDTGSSDRQDGYFLSAVNLVLVAVLLVILVFSLRLLYRSEPPEVQYSDRYHELVRRTHLSEAEKLELELEKCRFERDLLARYEKQQHPDFETARSKYRRSCAGLLPR